MLTKICNFNITLWRSVNEVGQSGETFALCTVLGFQVEMRTLWFLKIMATSLLCRLRPSLRIESLFEEKLFFFWKLKIIALERNADNANQRHRIGKVWGSWSSSQETFPKKEKLGPTHQAGKSSRLRTCLLPPQELNGDSRNEGLANWEGCLMVLPNA